MADIKQKIKSLKDELAKLEQKAKSEDTGQKVIIGGMLLSLSRKNKDIAKMTLAWIDENVTRKNDLDRLKPIIAELNEFLNPITAVIQDEQKENSKNDEVVEAVDDVEHGKDDKQKENPVVVVPTEQQQKENPVVEQKQQENPVEPVPTVQQQNNLGAVGVQGGQQLTKFFNNATTNI